MTNPRDDARAIFAAAVDAVNPAILAQSHLQASRQLMTAIGRARRIVVIGGGKAGASMAVGIEHALAAQLDRVTGLVNVPNAPIRPTERVKLVAARPTGCNEPTVLAVAATEEMLATVAGLTAIDLVICLLSGGGSALIAAPAHRISLKDKINTTRLLTASGVTIAELNCVRKHLSRVKGGQLAAASRAGSFCSLILSDVEGDRLDVIASGPTAPDPTTYADAVAIIERYGLRARVPSNIVAHLQRGAAGEFAETPKLLPDSVHNIVIGNNDAALLGAQAEAERRGYRALRLPPAFSDTTAEAQKLSDAIAQASAQCRAPICIIRGGETTVRLPQQYGLGGRNQQMAVQVGLSSPGATVLCASTDGEDGPTDAAGAIYDRDVARAAKAKSFDAFDYLARYDSYHFFEQTGGLLKTGLTGTNVMDVHIVLIHPEDAENSR